MSNELKRPPVKGTTPLLRGARATCEAHFYRWAPIDVEVENLSASSGIGGGFSSKSKQTKTNPLIVNNDLIRATVMKDKSSHTGQFTLILKAGRVGKDTDIYSNKPPMDYCESVNPGDWVVIYMAKTTGLKVEKENIKMLGIVERVYLEEVDNPQTGTPSQTYVISGKDFGKVFETQIFSSPIMNSQLAKSLYGADFLSDSLKSVKGSRSPDAIIKSLISFYYGGSFKSHNKEHELWYIPPALASLFEVDIQSKARPSFIDILDYSSFIGLFGESGKASGNLPGEMLVRALPSSGNIWQALAYHQNATINEMFVDLEFTAKGLQPAITLRQLPYAVKDGDLKVPTKLESSKRTFFDTLNKTSFDSSIIKKKGLSKIDSERINHIVVVPRVDTPLPFAYKASINPSSVQQYGLRSLVVDTGYAATSKQAFEDYCNDCVSILTECFFNSEKYYSGSISIEGLDTHVPLGNNIFISDIEQLFHVEGYTHNYEQNAGGTTSFTTDFSVIRGCSVNGSELNKIETATNTTIVKSVLENIPNRIGNKKP